VQVSGQFESAFRRLAASRLGEAVSSTRELAARLPPREAVELVQQAALETLDLGAEQLEGQRALSSLTDYQPLQTQPAVQAGWSHLQRKLWRTIAEPVVTVDPAIDLGSVAGAQVLLNPAKFDHPDDLWIVMGHEVAHAEQGHAVRREALRKLEAWVAQPSTEFRHELQEAIWGLELEADRRGLQLVADRLTEPPALLRHLLQTEGGPEHPDGLRRAEQARVTLMQCGHLVSDSTWQQLLEDTREVRQRYADRAEKERTVREAMKKFC